MGNELQRVLYSLLGNIFSFITRVTSMYSSTCQAVTGSTHTRVLLDNTSQQSIERDEGEEEGLYRAGRLYRQARTSPRC